MNHEHYDDERALLFFKLEWVIYFLEFGDVDNKLICLWGEWVGYIYVYMIEYVSSMERNRNSIEVACVYNISISIYGQFMLSECIEYLWFYEFMLVMRPSQSYET